MKTYQEMSKEELTQELTALKAEYEKIKGMGLALDMSRGKPGADQLDLSMGMLDVLDSKTALKSENGTDLRNYGVLDGIPEAKKLIADVIACICRRSRVLFRPLRLYHHKRRAALGCLSGKPWLQLRSSCRITNAKAPPERQLVWEGLFLRVDYEICFSSRRFRK